MAPTEELECEHVSTPDESIFTEQVVDFVPALIARHRAGEHIEEGELIPVDPYGNAPIPYLPNLHDILRDAAGGDNLESVSEVKLKVIAHEVGLQHLSRYMPTLRELILDGSVVRSLRDLGSGLKSLKVLKVSRCGLTSLDGIYGMKNLSELTATHNYITDLTPCTALELIRHIDVRRNKLKNINILSFLSVCDSLRHIILEDNPNLTELTDYRDRVKKCIPKLKSLDGVEYPEDDANASTSRSTPSISRKKVSLPPIQNPRGNTSARLNTTSSSANCSYSVSFSPRVLSPGTDSSEDGSSTDIKVQKMEFPKL